jgi:hypothetical protein
MNGNIVENTPNISHESKVIVNFHLVLSLNLKKDKKVEQNCENQISIECVNVE